MCSPCLLYFKQKNVRCLGSLSFLGVHPHFGHQAMLLLIYKHSKKHLWDTEPGTLSI